MLHVQCPGCLTDAYIECDGCPDSLLASGTHLDACRMTNLDLQVTCPPGGSCCQEDHDHGAAANACPRDHTDPCPEPASCKVWAGMKAAVHPDAEPPPHLAHLTGDCPGGHCHKDIPGCTVCRPLIITVVPGSVELKPALGG